MDQDLTRLYGDWQELTGVLAGNAMPEEIVAATKLTLGHDIYQVDLAGNIDAGVCHFQMESNPLRMKIEGQSGPNAGKTYLAILEVIGEDQIRIAYDLSGSDYPASFDPTSEPRERAVVDDTRISGK